MKTLPTSRFLRAQNKRLIILCSFHKNNQFTGVKCNVILHDEECKVPTRHVAVNNRPLLPPFHCHMSGRSFVLFSPAVILYFYLFTNIVLVIFISIVHYPALLRLSTGFWHFKTLIKGTGRDIYALQIRLLVWVVLLGQ